MKRQITDSINENLTDSDLESMNRFQKFHKKGRKSEEFRKSSRDFTKYREFLKILEDSKRSLNTRVILNIIRDFTTFQTALKIS